VERPPRNRRVAHMFPFELFGQRKQRRTPDTAGNEQGFASANGHGGNVERPPQRKQCLHGIAFVYAPQRLCAVPEDLIDELNLAAGPAAPQAVNRHGASPHGVKCTGRFEHGELSRRKCQRGLRRQREVAVAAKRTVSGDGEPDVLHGNPPVWKTCFPTKTCRRNVVNRNVRRGRNWYGGLASGGAAR
jgi:hypothetical protein